MNVDISSNRKFFVLSFIIFFSFLLLCIIIERTKIALKLQFYRNLHSFIFFIKLLWNFRPPKFHLLLNENSNTIQLNYCRLTKPKIIFSHLEELVWEEKTKRFHDVQKLIFLMLYIKKSSDVCWKRTICIIIR